MLHPDCGSVSHTTLPGSCLLCQEFNIFFVVFFWLSSQVDIIFDTKQVMFVLFVYQIPCKFWFEASI